MNIKALIAAVVLSASSLTITSCQNFGSGQPSDPVQSLPSITFLATQLVVDKAQSEGDETEKIAMLQQIAGALGLFDGEKLTAEDIEKIIGPLAAEKKHWKAFINTLVYQANLDIGLPKVQVAQLLAKGINDALALYAQSEQ